MGADTRRKTQDAVDALRSAMAGCDLALLADWETGMVLCTDSDTSLPHDAQEEIAQSARADLRAPWLTGIKGQSGTITSTRIGARTSIIGLRRAASDEILVCRCAKITDRDALHRIADEVFDILSPMEGTEA